MVKAHHHHEHGHNASVPMKGSGRAIPSGRWEKMYSTNDPSRNMILTEGADFNAKCAKDRKTTHVKVNETDH